ncbi:MAG TPA: PepSY domain-containing protein [Verrucomicrobiae bacterium]|jgi:hypothetical protein|nr:PepSY domain-containing protein [Verrucomicrobiae bacterium]
MPTFDKINRRTHLYLGLFLLPWLTMYGLSSFIVIHQSWFGGGQALAWEPLFEREYHRPVSDTEDLRATAQEILKDNNLQGAFWVDKPNPDTVHIDRFTFRGSTSLNYSLKEQKLRAKHQRMKLPQFVMRMHFRGGYGQPTFWDKFWGFLVDLACVTIIIWIASGLIMWWRLPRLRAWGAIALGSGILSFLLLIWTL